MTPARIQALRHALGENTKQFGERFFRSGRTVEGWEQGQRTPDPLAIQALLELERKTAKTAEKTRA